MEKVAATAAGWVLAVVMIATPGPAAAASWAQRAERSATCPSAASFAIPSNTAARGGLSRVVVADGRGRGVGAGLSETRQISEGKNACPEGDASAASVGCFLFLKPILYLGLTRLYFLSVHNRRSEAVSLVANDQLLVVGDQCLVVHDQEFGRG